MKLETIQEHTVDTDLLQPGGWVLDLGCTDFEFTRSMVARGMRVIAFDPRLSDPGISDLVYRKTAVVEDSAVAEASYYAWDEVLGHQIIRFSDKKPGDQVIPAGCATIDAILRAFKVDIFDAVKINTGGMEYRLLEKWPGLVTKQISVQFHDHLGKNPDDPNNDAWYSRTFDRMDAAYEVVQHTKSPLPENPDVLTYRDSLLVGNPFR